MKTYTVCAGYRHNKFIYSEVTTNDVVIILAVDEIKEFLSAANRSHLEFVLRYGSYAEAARQSKRSANGVRMGFRQAIVDYLYYVKFPYHPFFGNE